jgi:class 3 adenylate cyclase
MAEERRIVTILFADVVGSTSMGETLDPEDLRHLLGTYFETARGIIEEYGGTVEKFIGDAVMAVFGVPRAHDDDARRALSAALDLRERLRADPRLAELLPIRIGINTGEVVSGVGGSTDQLLVTGDPVNVAARLQEQADPWSILCGERTVAASGGAFAFGPSTRLEARGRAAAIRANELLGSRVPAAATTPFVGRDSDMAQVELLAQRAFGERRPWLLTIVAPPGTGKSRLLAEFIDRLPAISPDATVVVAHCLPYGQRLAYQPLRTVLHELVGRPEGTPPAELLDAATAWLDEWGVAEPRRTASLLGATIGLPTTEPPVESELLAAWRTFFEAAAARHPLIIAFDDLHWSSDSLLDLLELAMQPRADVPALLIGIARPELLDRRPSWASGRRNQVTIDLAPLADEPVATIVAHLLASTDPDLIGSIVARAEGNPFFAGEIARAVVERDGGDSRDRRGLPIASHLPDTVQATIQARFDLLDPADRRVLQLGAIFGRSFEAAGVAAISAADPAEVGRSVSRLIDRDLVAAADRGEVAARHILIRDVAYHTLPRMDRARGHAAAAAWLADRAVDPDGEPTELIAFHYREAATLMGSIDLAPKELPAVRAQAVDWLRRAADRALGAAASADVVDYLQGAIELADPDGLPALYERLGDAHLQGELTADSYRRALDPATIGSLPPDTRLRILGKLLMEYTRSQGALARRPSSAEIAGIRSAARTLLPAATDERAIARFLVAEAFLPFWARPGDETIDRASARAGASQGLAIAERLDDPDLRSAALDGLTALAETWPEAFGHASDRLGFEERLQLVERIDAHSMVAWCASTIGRLDVAERVSAAGLALVEEGQVPTYALHLAVWRAYALRLLGRWDELAGVADRAAALWEATGRSAAAFAVRGFLAGYEVARARGERERAGRFAAILREILDQFPPENAIRRTAGFLDEDPAALTATLADLEWALKEEAVLARADYVERALARCCDDGVRLPEADLRRIADGARAVGCRLLEAQAHRALGLVLEDAGGLRTALAIVEEAGARPSSARIRIELGELSGDEAAIEAGRGELAALGVVDRLARRGGGIGSRP